MLWQFIYAAVVAMLSLWPAQLDAYITQSAGCHHNGTWYADRSLVPTVEKCLTCQCQKKTLVCRLKVCPEMPMPPPRGCIVVQQRNACCPYLSCARLDAFYKIPATRRIIAYLDHYERESIDRVVNDNMLQRRSDDSEVDMYVCVKNGTVYKSGSAMSSSNLCTYCYCIGGTEKCVKPKCMLPVEGCKPIFVDSTCCPVRYDCTSKPSGKSSQEVRYRKTSNKHYLRMSQRLQRNRGCTVDKQFYVEGQKMRSDPDKPCDICFCIRGTRRCAPKKCSPALKNCIPVVPKGQCCPSSYDCGSQRAQSSRQFNLFSLLFGKEDEVNGNGTKRIPVEYPPDRHPSVTVTHNQNILEKNDEKSILDTIREGLEIIDGNNDEVIAVNIDKLGTPLTKVVTEPELSTQTTTLQMKPTEVSLLDLLLGTDDEKPIKVAEEILPELKTTTPYEGLDWVDILLGPDENEKKSVKTTIGERIGTTTSYMQESTMPSIDRIDHEFEDFSGNGEIIVGEPQSSESLENPISEDLVGDKNSIKGRPQVALHKHDVNNNLESSYLKNDEALKEVQVKVLSTTSKTTKSTTTRPQTTTTALNTTTTAKPTQNPSSKPTTKISMKTTQNTTVPAPTRKPVELKFVPKTTHKPAEKLHKTTTTRPLKTTQSSTKSPPEKKKNGLLTTLLDGLSDMLGAEKILNGTQVKTAIKTNVTATSTTSKPPKEPITVSTPESKPMPSFKPLPSGKPTHTRINSKIANLTVTPEVIQKPSVAPNISAFKPLPTQDIKIPILVTANRVPATNKTPTALSNMSETTTKTTTKTTTITTPAPQPSSTATSRTTTRTTTTTTSRSTTTSLSSTTPKPVMIKTNPTILEADPFDANAEPTLPPSLPNLKIIPFLPTDAVKADRNKPPYDYYHSNAPTAKIDYDQYDEGNLYPAITEAHFPIYPEIGDGSKAEYIYKFNVEGPPPPVMSSTASKLDGSSGAPDSFVKYDFVGDMEHKGFSPPTKTEGGFLPKNPLLLNDDEEQAGALPYIDAGYQVTKHLIDITTSDPLRENITKVIEITTPDPFKDVIRTEPPPDLTSLIEDKAKILIQNPLQQQPTKVYEDPENLSQSLIHITTSAPQFLNAVNEAKPSDMQFLETNVEHTMRNGSKLPTEEHKNTIASFLDLLLGGAEELSSPFAASNTTIGSSTVPPFKILPQTAVKLIPNTTTTSTLALPSTEMAALTKHTQKTTSIPNSTTANLSSSATLPVAPTKLNATTSSAVALTASTTKIKTRTKSPLLHRNNTVVHTTKLASTTRPKSTRPKSSSSRRQTTKASNAALTSIQKRANITTTMRYPTTITSTTQPKTKPLLRSPFDTLPFMDTSFEVKRTTERTFVVGQYADGDFLGLLHYKNSLNQFEGLEPARESFPHSTVAPSFSSSVTPPTATPTSVPLVQRNIEQIISAAPQSLDALAASAPAGTQHTASNSLIDPAGVLKLAGCNIYGRMYRVGRIILELSSPCLECKCTEVGVKCGQLDC